MTLSLLLTTALAANVMKLEPNAPVPADAEFVFPASFAHPKLAEEIGLDRWVLVPEGTPGSWRPGEAHAFSPPSDDYFGEQWGLYNDGSRSGSVAGMDIGALRAWEIHVGSEDVIVAVIDTGVVMNEPDLVGRMWRNEDEIPGNGIDDDGNGYVDDAIGYNFDGNVPSVIDGNGHGSKVAGIILAEGNNGVGVAGVCWRCTLMPLKALSDAGSGSYTGIAQAIRYAVDNGADVINLSLGGSFNSSLMQDAVTYAVAANVSVIAASGNNNSGSPFYPAACDGALAVGATVDSGWRASPNTTGNWGANYGPHLGIVAPGHRINGLAANPGHYWTSGSGTSFAAPYVAGVAALLKSADPDLTAAEIETMMLDTALDQVGDPNEDVPGWDPYMGWGLLRADGAMEELDLDRDGSTIGDGDCDDNNPDVAPHLPELCNGIDEDCDGEIDEEAVDRDIGFEDGDGDGFGGGGRLEGCDMGWLVPNAGDCDDSDPNINPGAVEICDGIDQNCNTLIDDDAIDSHEGYFDSDGDGYGFEWVLSCESDGLVNDGGDCDDEDASIHPNALEICDGVDQDCDGEVDEDAGDAVTGFPDADQDGFGVAPVITTCDSTLVSTVDGDCDDSDPYIAPGQQELCDGVDQDCDGEVDEGLETQPTGYVDADGDGIGAGDPVMGCQDLNLVPVDGDCDDQNDLVYPGAEERCDWLDQDCDGEIDEDAVDAYNGYIDMDEDTFGTGPRLHICFPPGPITHKPWDCNDEDPTINPKGIEVCDGVDQDCDGEIDEDAVDIPSGYEDLDGDGHGSGPLLSGCGLTGLVPSNDDCDDTDSTIRPGAPETCDGVDEDCDGEIDENASDASRGYVDLDGDGTGSGDYITTCEPVSLVPRGDDCDDADPLIRPGAIETCDGVDQNCNSLIDDNAVDRNRGYIDRDGDGRGAGPRVEGCGLTDLVPQAGDCNDNDPGVRPGMTETCDGVDQDCNNIVDDNAVDARSGYLDSDGDGHGTGALLTGCDLGELAPGADDCDDFDAGIYPGALELCDGRDQDCDGVIDNDAVDSDSGYVDNDNDGFGDGEWIEGCRDDLVDEDGDCDDSDPSVSPIANETCDLRDEDCDGEIDEGATGAVSGYYDNDGDGVGAGPLVHVCDCTNISKIPGDCDDNDIQVRPGAMETCDGRDEDCDGLIDEDAVDQRSGFVDGDGDGVGSGAMVETCGDEELVTSDWDCDDTNPNDTWCDVRLCGCASTSTQSSWLGMWVLALLMFRRRAVDNSEE